MTSTARIQINGLNDVYEFIRQAMMVDGDITIFRGNYAVDAKSVLGVFSIDLSQVATLSYPEDATEFEEYVAKFTV